MISYLRGQVKHKSVIPKKDNFIILDVSGVGYKVFVLDKFINEIHIGNELEVFIYTQVAETVLDLYGFSEQEELEFFELLISISGIGPRSALDILQKAKIEDLRAAAQSGNAEVLSKVSGIGPKTAERIVVGLKDKLGSIPAGASAWNDEFGEALEALVGLGYAPNQAQEALSHCQANDTGAKIKEALRILGRR
ncbi:Holliday junction branch migration protein RuvA [Candidatus Falkowbacteria bacterium]|nr:Holliday junction branch migration protein RuvA [Candidatus Falkowbacteria bacterium]